MRTVWQSQTTEVVNMSLEQLQQASRKMQRKVFWRNFREYIALAYLVVVLAYFFWTFDALLLRAGAAAMIAGALYVGYQLHKRASAKKISTEMTLDSCLSFHRKQLQREHDFLRNIWRWYLLPHIPGMVLFLVGLFKWMVDGATHHLPAAAVPVVLGMLVVVFVIAAARCAAVFARIAKSNQSAACQLQAQINELDALESKS
jgi:hypothetical protein